VRDFTDNVATNFDLCTIVHAMARNALSSVSSTDLAHVYVKHASTIDRASGCRCVLLWAASSPPLVHTTGFQHAFLGVYVASRWSRHCTDSRPVAMSTLQSVASLHAVIFTVPMQRSPRLPPCRLPQRWSPRPRTVFVTPSGSSSPTLSTVAALSQVACMATFDQCRPRGLPLQQSRHPA
jgi:hypothetical protein